MKPSLLTLVQYRHCKDDYISKDDCSKIKSSSSPGDNKIISVAHAPHGFDDFCFIILDHLDPFKLLNKQYQHGCIN